MAEFTEGETPASGFLRRKQQRRDLREYIRIGEVNRVLRKFILAVLLKLYQKSMKLQLGD